MRITAGLFVVLLGSAIQPPALSAQNSGASAIQSRVAGPAPPSVPMKLPKGVTLEMPLTEDHVVAIALWNNAALQADLMALGVARADLLDAGLLRNPSLQVLLPFGYTQFEMLLNLPGEILWQRPRRVAAAKLEVERTAHGLEQNGLDLVRDVRVAYWDLLLAGERSRLGQESVRLRREIAELTEARLRAGEISELEANTARLDLSSAEEEAARLARARELAHGRLRHLMGLQDDRVAFDVARPADPLARVDLSPTLKLDELQAEALSRTSRTCVPLHLLSKPPRPGRSGNARGFLLSPNC